MKGEGISNKLIGGIRFEISLNRKLFWFQILESRKQQDGVTPPSDAAVTNQISPIDESPTEDGRVSHGTNTEGPVRCIITNQMLRKKSNCNLHFR